MKKLTALVLTLVFTLSLSMTAFAAQISQGSNPGTADVEVTTSIAPTYTVTIPSNTSVIFQTLSTSFGTVKLEAAQIDPGYAVRVQLTADGKLENQADNDKTIAYSVKAGDSDFTQADYTTAGQKTDLTIEIEEDAWNSAYAGSYSDTVVFTVSYVALSATAP